jgi:DNA replication and repair protein RecF
MWFGSVRGRDFRAFERFALTPHPRHNLVLGDNGAGKTSLLEALCVLTRGASPRAAPAALVRDGSSDWHLKATVGTSGAPQDGREVEVWWGAGRCSAVLDGARQTQAQLAASLPLQVIDPARVRIVEGDPTVRRRLLDWGLFHVEQRFLPCWRRLRVALAQRNAALRQGAPSSALAPWDREFEIVALELDDMRQRYWRELEPALQGQLATLLPGERWEVRYARGWSSQRTLAEALARSHGQDRRLQRTTNGPHRAELWFAQDGHPARGRASRGQQKLLVAALVLAQCRLIERKTGRAPVVLLDDFCAELSAAAQARLWAELAGYAGQVFVSALEFPEAARGADLAVFHVEHGTVRRQALIE